MVDGFVHGLSQSSKDVTDPISGSAASKRSNLVGGVPITEYDRYQFPRCILTLPQVDDASIDFSLWCFPDSPACVVHERGYGLTSIIRQNAEPDLNPESRQDLPILNLVNACITPRKTLIYVVKPSLLSSRREFRFKERLLMSESDRPTCISKEGTVHGAVITKWKKSAIAVAAQGESTEVITLCTFKSNMVEVIKYIVDYKTPIIRDEGN